MNKKIIKLIMAGMVLGVIIFPTFCSAATIADTITKITTDIVNPIATALIALMVIYAGILFVTSAGDPGKVSTAKACLLWAVIGGILIVVANVIVNTIKTVT